MVNGQRRPASPSRRVVWYVGDIIAFFCMGQGAPDIPPRAVQRVHSLGGVDYSDLPKAFYLVVQISDFFGEEFR